MGSRLEQKTALITGAGQGIGAAVAEVFAREGANLVLFDKRLEPMTAFAEELAGKYGSKVFTRQVDVSDHAAVQDAVSESIEHLQRLDILINNVGVNVFSDPLELTAEDWQRCFSVDLSGAWHCCQAILPHMLERKYGNIVNIASVHGHKIIRGAFPYPVAKHGLIGMTRALGIEYAARGIRVNSISPGLIDTPQVNDYMESFADPDLERERQRQILPCKRFGQPLEVANTALFLASDEAAFINATDILIDGGRSQVYCD